MSDDSGFCQVETKLARIAGKCVEPEMTVLSQTHINIVLLLSHMKRRVYLSECVCMCISVVLIVSNLCNQIHSIQ